MSNITLPVEIVNDQQYMRNAKDCLVPIEQVRPIDIARTELVLEKVAKAKALQKQLRDLKYEILADADALVDMSADRYGVKLGGKKDNLTLSTYDGAYQLKRQIKDRITFDEGLHAAKALIDQCLTYWSKGSPSELRAIVEQAFDVDKEGKINTSRILGLMRLDIADERWQTAMHALGECIQVIGSRVYVQLAERNAAGGYDAISLNIAAL